MPLSAWNRVMTSDAAMLTPSTFVPARPMRESWHEQWTFLIFT